MKDGSEDGLRWRDGNDMDAEEIKRGDREGSWRHRYGEGGKGCGGGKERRMTEG